MTKFPTMPYPLFDHTLDLPPVDPGRIEIPDTVEEMFPEQEWLRVQILASNWRGKTWPVGEQQLRRSGLRAYGSVDVVGKGFADRYVILEPGPWYLSVGMFDGGGCQVQPGDQIHLTVRLLPWEVET
jgi:hypothetical protein